MNYLSVLRLKEKITGASTLEIWRYVLTCIAPVLKGSYAFLGNNIYITSTWIRHLLIIPLKFIKNRLRSTLTLYHLETFILISVEKDIAHDIYNDAIVDCFIQKFLIGKRTESSIFSSSIMIFLFLTEYLVT